MRVNSMTTRLRLVWVSMVLFLGTAAPSLASAAGGDPPQEPPCHHTGDAGPTSADHGCMGAIGAKLADPTSNIWALFTEFDLDFSDGDANKGDPKVGGDMIFQPILPIPLYGEGTNQWKLINRPTLPVIFSTPIRKAFNDFSHSGGLGDMTWPMLLSPPTGNWLLGLGPTWLFPTATKGSLGLKQFGIGPTAIVGYKTRKITVGVFPQYFFKVGSVGNGDDNPDASFMNLLYFAFLNLPDAWQVGFNPVITYNHRATSGNKWNVPIGLVVAKTTAVGKRPVKFQFGLEYSVVSQDDFGKRFLVKLNVIPVIEGLIKNPIFGGG